MPNEFNFHHNYRPVGLRLRPEAETLYSKFATAVATRVTNAIGQRHLTLIDHRGNYQLTNDDREKIRYTTTQIVQESMGDLDPRSADAKRIIEMGPLLLDTVIASPYIDAVNKHYLLDLVRWSIEGARNPELIARTTIRVGFGGSQDEQIPMRHPAYYLPAIDLWKKIDAVRKSREEKVDKLKADYVFHTHETDGMEKEEKQKLYERTQTEAQLKKLDSGILEQLRKNAGIFEMPQIEFFFVPNAGIAINTMDPKKVQTQADASMKLIGSFLRRFYPDAFSATQFKVDSPSKKYGIYSRIALDYLVNVIDRYDGEDLSTLMELLRKLGNNHGRENGHALAGHYAAIHPVVFQDLLSLPPLSSIIDEDSSWANITIGGRPERLFNRIRELLSEHSSPEDFLQFVQDNIHNYSENPEYQDSVVKRIAYWVVALKNRREQYKTQSSQNWARADLPLITVPIITDIGAHPVYYFTPYDIALTRENIEMMRKGQKIRTAEPDSPPERNRKQSVQGDFDKLISAIGLSELLEFYDSFLSDN